ncbi:Tyrosine-protein kinase [Parasponia andersonii]|uniref:Tyrosine-protein kinase n=1 Tax=Parasponia andersonii TaxID=3476 RepID=A0A2P5AYD6_PARAD|nr:Tyrosine-protein kinase [Parasponia andersonii]
MTDALWRDYQVLEEIGRGRFGTVYKCVPLNDSGDFFAVKSIDKRMITGDSLESQCLVTEPKLLHLVTPHPHIINLHNLYEDEAHLHMVLDLCDSIDLHGRVTRRVFAEPEAASVMAQLMQAVAHCHRLGGGGLMRGIVGTPYYVAPEVLSGRDYSEKVDVWSAGVVLYVILAGFPPFYGESMAEIFKAVVRANLRFPATAFHSVSPAAKDLLRRMVCKDVCRRFSAEQVLRHPWITSGGGQEQRVI